MLRAAPPAARETFRVTDSGFELLKVVLRAER